MRVRNVWWTAKVVALGSLILPLAASPQSPRVATLIVKSDPRGASIKVNDRDTGQYTDAEFTVTPGDYHVSVSPTPASSAKCSNSKQVPLQAGQTTTFTCNKDGGWSIQ